MEKKGYYEVLKVDKKATQKEIKNSFRKKAKKYHPDRAKNISKEEAKRKFIKVREAFEVLGNSEKRKKYDDKFKKV